MFPFGSLLTAEGGETARLVTTNESHISVDPDVGAIILSISALTGGNNLQRGFVQWDGYDVGDAVTYANIYSWVDPQDFEGTYYVRATSSGVTPEAGVLDTWLALVKDVNSHFWRWSHDGPTPEVGVLLLQIDTVGDGSNIIAAATHTMSVSAAS